MFNTNVYYIVIIRIIHKIIVDYETRKNETYD